MEESKFQIDITQGNLDDLSKIPQEIERDLCSILKLESNSLNAVLHGKNKETILVCNQTEVDKVFELLNSLGLSAEAQILKDNPEDDSLFGDLEIGEINFDLEQNKEEAVKENSISTPASPNQEQESDDLGFFLETESEEDEINLAKQTLVKDEKKSTSAPEQKLNSINGFVLEEIEDDSSLNKPENKTQNEGGASLGLELKTENEESSDLEAVQELSLKKSDLNQNVRSVDPKTNEDVSLSTKKNEMKEAFTDSASLPTADPEPNLVINTEDFLPLQSLDSKSSVPKNIFIFVVGACLMAGLLYVLFPSQNELSSKPFTVTQSQIKSIVSKKTNSKPIVPHEKENIEEKIALPTESFKGELELDNFLIKVSARVSGNNLTSLNFELENRHPIIISEEEFVSKNFLPKLISVRGMGYPLENKTSLSIAARINYKIGGENKKLIYPTFARLSPDLSMVVLYDSSLESGNNEKNQIEMLKQVEDNKIYLQMYLEVPLQQVIASEEPKRSISDLIDNQLQGNNNKEEKKNKRKPKKKKLDE